MDFFTNLIRQPPVTDKHKRHDFSQYSDEFTITRQKGLRGFNDEVSEIEIGSEHINQDSINEIKNQQKLLLGQEESNKKMRMYQYESKDDSFDGRQFGLIDTDKSKKDQNNIKVSLESKLMAMQFPAPQHKKVQQQIITKDKTYQPSIKPNLSIIKMKKVHSEIIINLAELKKIKSQIKQYFQQQQNNLKKLIGTVRYNLQIEIKRQFLAYSSRQQQLISNNLKKVQKGQQIALKSKLKQSQDLIKQMQKQLEQVCEQNETLQQKLFDMQQKMVGIDLQVQERFQKKKKQLQSKIIQDVMAKYNQSQQNPYQNKNFQQNQDYNQNITNLINQNQYLQQKLKSYQALLLQTDHIRRTKQQIQQLQFTLNQRQQQILNKKRQAEKIFIEANKRSIDLQNTEDSLNKKLNQLKEKLKVKEESLEKWEKQLQIKQNKLNQQFAKKTFEEDDFHFNNNYKIESLNFKKSNYETSSIKNGSSQDVFRKASQQNTQKVQTSRHHKTQCSDDRPLSSNKIIYDPKKHQKYQQFDSTQREKYYMKNQDMFNFKQRDNRTQRLITSKNLDLLNLNNNNNNNRQSAQFGNKSEIYIPGSKDLILSNHKLDSNRSNQPIEIKKTNVDFYRPSTSNTYKYEPQYVPKPPSSPLNGNKTVRFDNNRNISPHQRENSVASYNKSTTNSNRLHVDIRDRHYQPSHDRSLSFKSSMDNSVISGHSKTTNRVNYQGYDMKKSKSKYEVTKLNNLGDKIEFLKSQLKSQIDNML